MNPVVMICYENIELTKDAVASVFAQDVPVYLTLVDNGCTDGTAEWARSLEVPVIHEMEVIRYDRNTSPVAVANFLMKQIFRESEYVMFVPNDVVLPVCAYRQFLRWPRGIVTGSQTDAKANISEPGHVSSAVNECTPMAVVLFRRWAYEALIAKDGMFFDERLRHYCSDCDLALRVSACGIRGIQTDLIYWHYGSASHRLSSPEVGVALRREADEDRRRFTDKWGFAVTAYEYGQCAVDINFRG